MSEKINQTYLTEHTKPLTEIEAVKEAARCLLCHDAPCSKRCPAGTEPASFIRSIRFGNFYGAAKTIRKANILGGVCSRVCPYKNLCEDECARGKIDEPIKIGLLQKFATDYEHNNDIKVLTPIPSTKGKIAIIGSGPAGLAGAAELAISGYAVTVFETQKVLGGVLSTGILPARLPKEIVDIDIQHIKRLGVKFKTNCKIGKDITFDELRGENYKAFLLAVGNTVPRRLNIGNSKNTIGINSARDFLLESKLSDGNIHIGKNVVVIGGGDVALDAALTAKLLGSESVTILYRRRLEDMPASIEEIDYARHLNINFYTRFTPKEYITKDGAVKGIKASGTYTESEISIEADMIIEAIGQDGDDIASITGSSITLDRNKIVINNENGQTNIKDIFSAGDIVNGGATVVDAIKQGKIAANGIKEFLTEKKKSKPKIKRQKSLEIDFCGVKCENPFFLSSSPVGGNYDMCAKALETGWGGIVYKTIGKFIANECSPRFDNTSKEGTPFVGFKNMEQISDKPLEKNLEMMQKLKKDYPDKVLVASIMGANEEEWTDLAKLVTEIGADIIECNFSCPQMTSHDMGSDVGQNPDLVRTYSAAVRNGTHLPIIAKMTPNIGNMEAPAIASIEGGANALAAINTIKAITAIDLDKFVCLPIVNGKSSISGYSGKAVKPIALRFIAEMAQHAKLSNIPISGMGGIETWIDAVEFFLVGASNLQVTTSVMQYGYRIVEDLISGVSHYLDIKGFNSISDIVGIGLKNIISAEDLDRSFIIKAQINDKKCIGCGRCYISCYDGGHQAIRWDYNRKLPIVDDDKCVGCHLCTNICPVSGSITYGEIEFKNGKKAHDIII